MFSFKSVIKVIIKAIIVTVLVLLTLAICAPMFGTSIIAIFQHYKVLAVAVCVVFPLIYVPIDSWIGQRKNVDPSEHTPQ